MSRLVVHIGMPKTGTSSIQETLFLNGGVGDIRYANFGMPNHGGAICSAFYADPGKWRVHQAMMRSSTEILEFNNKMISLFRDAAEQGGEQIISGEDIWHLSESSLTKFRDFFAPYFDKILVVGYVRSPASFIVSAFQQLVKNHGLSTLEPCELYPKYRIKFEKFDTVFGKENVILRPFDASRLAQGDVVVDFCHLLKADIHPHLVKRSNESMSLEATAVLFAYRKYGKKYIKYLERERDNRALVDGLYGFGSRKLCFANSLVFPVLQYHKEDIYWMEERLGESIADQDNDHPDAIVSEAQLLKVAAEQRQALEEHVRFRAAEVDPTPEKIAHWVERLRIAVTGRDSNGQDFSCPNEPFFTPEQIAILEDKNLGPAVALRELALAFERQGQMLEALSVIEAAIHFRPDAVGLRNLHQRMSLSS